MVTSVRFPVDLYKQLEVECESSGLVMKRYRCIIIQQFLNAVKNDLSLLKETPKAKEKVGKAVYIDDELKQEMDMFIKDYNNKYINNKKRKLTASQFIVNAVMWKLDINK